MKFEHMPFLVTENILLFCESGDLQEAIITPSNTIEGSVVNSIQYVYRCWKMFKKDLQTGIKTPIHSGLPDYAIECCPSAYLNGDTWKISFIGNLTSLDFKSKSILYQIQTNDWINFSDPIKLSEHPTRWGFENSKISALVGKDKNIIVNTNTDDIIYYVKVDFDIYTVRYLAEDHMCLVVTGKTSSNIFKTLLINLISKEIKEIKDSSNNSTYKATKYGNILAHAIRLNNFEQRQIVFDTPSLIDSDVSVSIDTVTI